MSRARPSTYPLPCPDQLCMVGGQRRSWCLKVCDWTTLSCCKLQTAACTCQGCSRHSSWPARGCQEGTTPKVWPVGICMWLLLAVQTHKYQANRRRDASSVACRSLSCRPGRSHASSNSPLSSRCCLLGQHHHPAVPQPPGAASCFQSGAPLPCGTLSGALWPRFSTQGRCIYMGQCSGFYTINPAEYRCKEASRYSPQAVAAVLLGAGKQGVGSLLGSCRRGARAVQGKQSFRPGPDAGCTARIQATLLGELPGGLPGSAGGQGPGRQFPQAGPHHLCTYVWCGLWEMVEPRRLTAKLAAHCMPEVWRCLWGQTA